MTTIDTTTQTHEHQLRSHVTAADVAGAAMQVRLQTRGHTFTIDEPEELGGADTGANPVEHLLASLGSCQVITYQVWADKLDLQIDTIDIQLYGDIDLRGFFGLADSARPGFQGINVDVTVTGPEKRERYDELIAKVEKHCPVLDSLANTVPIRATATVA